MKKKVLVLGCGMVGAAMARDLADDALFEVTVTDLNPVNLEKLADRPAIKTRQADLGSPERVYELAQDCDLVVGAMPSLLGYQTLRAVIESGKSFTDISFMIEDPTDLDELAKRQGVTVIFDCGVAPGLANMIIGHCHAQLDETHDVVYYVGGLPKRRVWPYQYKAPFAPSDVIEEYVRPARMIEDGRLVIKPALSELELIDFPRVGTLEGFNTDGLRSLLNTVQARNMREKTLRYPGHAELMRALRDSGFFDKRELEIRGMPIRPLDLTTQLLKAAWRLEPGEEEFTILRVVVEGVSAGKATRYTYDLYDEFDAASGLHSMARTTGFPNTIMARLIARGDFAKRGVFPPESVGAVPGMLEKMTEELARRGVVLESRQERLNT